MGKEEWLRYIEAEKKADKAIDAAEHRTHFLQSSLEEDVCAINWQKRLLQDLNNAGIIVRDGQFILLKKTLLGYTQVGPRNLQTDRVYGFREKEDAVQYCSLIEESTLVVQIIK